MTTDVLTLTGVGKTHRRGADSVRVLDGIDLGVSAEEFVVVTGPSGAGKSSLLHVMGGLERPDSGTVEYGGRDLWAMTTAEQARFRRRNLGFVFQFFNLVPTLTAIENVSLPLVLDGVPARQADARGAHLLDRVGLGGRGGHRPAELSGGQMQRVAVARALAARPDVLLADEPTGNLDSRTSVDVLDILREVAADDGTAIVMVTHQEDLAARYATRRVTLIDGRCATGTLPVRGER